MKRIFSLGVMTALMLAGSAYGQGTVTFANSSTTLIVCADGAAWVYGVSIGAPVPKDPNPALKASLYYSSTENGTYRWLADASFSKLSPGRFSGLTQTIADIAPDATAWFQVKVWEVATGVDSFEQALTHDYGNRRMGINGVSSVFKVTLGAAAPGVLADSLTGFDVGRTPEPSTVALGLLGLAGMFVMRRRS